MGLPHTSAAWAFFRWLHREVDSYWITSLASWNLFDSGRLCSGDFGRLSFPGSFSPKSLNPISGRDRNQIRRRRSNRPETLRQKDRESAISEEWRTLCAPADGITISGVKDRVGNKPELALQKAHVSFIYCRHRRRYHRHHHCLRAAAPRLRCHRRGTGPSRRQRSLLCQRRPTLCLQRAGVEFLAHYLEGRKVDVRSARTPANKPVVRAFTNTAGWPSSCRRCAIAG